MFRKLIVSFLFASCGPVITRSHSSLELMAQNRSRPGLPDTAPILNVPQLTFWESSMLAVVISDAAREGEFRFQRRKFGTTTSELRALRGSLSRNESPCCVCELAIAGNVIAVLRRVVSITSRHQARGCVHSIHLIETPPRPKKSPSGLEPEGAAQRKCSFQPTAGEL
jgi:hypothetical protein